jgi:hypothetical protein
VLAENEDDLDQLIQVVRDYQRLWRFQMNMSKTKKVTFGPRARLKAKDGQLDIERSDSYRYLGLSLQRTSSWKTAKDFMLRKARRAMTWSYNLLVRQGQMSVKGLTANWECFVRPHLEYAAEVWDDDSDWPEAEAVQRVMAKRILRASKRTPNEVVLGELGWRPLRARRRVLRLKFWAKILRADETRWVRRVYEESRRQAEEDPSFLSWAAVTSRTLTEVGLGDHWTGQNTDVQDMSWDSAVEAAVKATETDLWQDRMSSKPILDYYRQFKDTLVQEEYMKLPDPLDRMALARLRSGTHSLRVHTGRWERLMEEDGTVRRLTREERTCLHCEGGVDDEEHFLWACTTHDGIREELFRKLETHNKPDMLLALRTPANRRPVHAIKWVMQYGFAELAWYCRKGFKDRRQ